MLEVIAHHQGNWGRIWERKPEAGTKTEAREGCCLLFCFLWLTQFAFYTTQDHLAKDGITHRRMGPPTTISQQENSKMPYRLGYTLKEAFFFQLRFPLSSLCQVDKTKKKKQKTKKQKKKKQNNPNLSHTEEYSLKLKLSPRACFPTERCMDVK